MTIRFVAALTSALVVAGSSAAMAADAIKPRRGVLLTGMVHFSRPQEMTLRTGRSDGSRLTVRMAFDGKCKGGGLGEAFASGVLTRQTVRVRDARFSSDLSGTVRNLGGMKGRSGEFRWHLAGHFTKRDVAVATVTGTAQIKKGKRVISRCKIAKPATVRLARRT